MRDADAVAAMLCPVCKVGLSMSDRQGVEIDYCPQCRGVWLDRGELDKILERSGAGEQGGGSMPPPGGGMPPQSPGMAPMRPPAQGYYGDDAGRHGGGYGQHGHHGQRRKKSFLSELFD